MRLEQDNHGMLKRVCQKSCLLGCQKCGSVHTLTADIAHNKPLPFGEGISSELQT